MTDSDTGRIFERLAWPIRLTWAGLWCERTARAFWPLWTVLATTLAALAFGAHENLPLEAAWFCLVAAVAGMVGTGWWGLRRFRRPTRTDALARLDSALPGHPIAALTDTQAIGAADPASLAVWQAHRARMAARAAAARPVAPDLALAARDPFALRYVALTALVMALLFGSLWRVASVTALAPGAGPALAGGPVWEGWAQPPVHTGKPSLYLNDITQARLELPVGTHVQIRLYGAVGALTLAETVSNRTDPAPASDPAQDFDVTQSGNIEIAGPGGRKWAIVATPDAKPTIVATGEISREASGEMKQGFTATDDYGVVAGQATIALDMPKLDRRYGLAIAPEPRDPIVLDLPMPINGSRTDFTETLIDDLSKHPFANLPVTITLAATDAIGQTGQAAPLAVTLPGRRFFDPLAAALIETRRDLLWSVANAPRAAQILKAVTHKPDGFIRNQRAYLRLRVLIADLDTAAQKGLMPAARDDIAEGLWQIALLVEEGDLASKLERLRRAQDRLDEAIKNGADKAEVDRLMADMRDALNDYLRQLAEESKNNPDQKNAENMQGMKMTGDQLQQMLDELEKAMKEGRTDDAAQMMDALRKLMENMQVTQGEGGQGGPGQQSMRDLADTLHDQQGLSDDSFQQLQDQFNGRPGSQPEGQQGSRASKVRGSRARTARKDRSRGTRPGPPRVRPGSAGRRSAGRRPGPGSRPAQPRPAPAGSARSPERPVAEPARRGQRARRGRPAAARPGGPRDERCRTRPARSGFRRRARPSGRGARGAARGHAQPRRGDGAGTGRPAGQRHQGRSGLRAGRPEWPARPARPQLGRDGPHRIRPQHASGQRRLPPRAATAR